MYPIASKNWSFVNSKRKIEILFAGLYSRYVAFDFTYYYMNKYSVKYLDGMFYFYYNDEFGVCYSLDELQRFLSLSDVWFIPFRHNI